MAAGERDPSPEEIEASVDAAIAACDGNPRATVRALLLVNAYEGASPYTLRIGLPNESSSCANSSSVGGSRMA